ncbi:MAG: hydrogenase 3 maturation endopeptidase HyCI [Candidatus Eisenbacteria bacterium]|nr:hydrogenase 3 maturation endopeptidase HyCI [Candidatus Eisenbacteria bacterium]
MPAGRLVVLGVGNSLRADDGAGCMVAVRLKARHGGLVFDAGQTPENFIGPLRRARPDVVLLVDAADFGGDPGEVRWASAMDVEGLMLGTHAAPLSMFMSVLEQETGAFVRLLAVQAATTELGGEPSKEVVNTIDTLVKELERELDGRTAP